MKQVSFYPGPSRVYDAVPAYVAEAHENGLLSVNHRSEDFMEMMAETKAILRKNLSIPEDYEIMFVSSATECWEILSQSLVKERMQHCYNGAFGKKWSDNSKKLGVEVNSIVFDPEEVLPVGGIDLSAEWICVTQNETSNGTFIDAGTLNELKSHCSNQFIAIDATSSMGGTALDLTVADYWFASVQKCFGLPAGMAILILSPRAIERAREIEERNHYNSLLWILANTEKGQTHHTPNVLNIYLLLRTQQAVTQIGMVEKKILERYESLSNAIDEHSGLDWLIKNPSVRSRTVLTVKHADVTGLLKQAREQEIILGNGYGDWKRNTFRIANFPALLDEEVDQLIEFLGSVR